MEAELKAIFDSADKDGNGILSRDEIRKLLLEDSPHEKIRKRKLKIR